MDLRTLRYLVVSDVYRHYGRSGARDVLRELVVGFGGKYAIWLRVTNYLCSKGPLLFPLSVVARFVLQHLAIKYGISIPWRTDIGPGLYIGHSGGIVVSSRAVIGRNCNLSQGVTLGVSNRGRIGAPRIGDDVYIGPGAKVFGRIVVGDHAAIGANAVVSRHVKPWSIVVATSEVIHCDPTAPFGLKGSDAYVIFTDYPPR